MKACKRCGCTRGAKHSCIRTLKAELAYKEQRLARLVVEIDKVMAELKRCERLADWVILSLFALAVAGWLVAALT